MACSSAASESTYALDVNRPVMVAMASMLVAVPVLAAACGDEGDSGATLPPIVTTTTTTISLTTTTFIATYYEVKSGDNLGNIARALGVDMTELMALNSITDPNDIEAGQSLLIPPPTILIESLPTG